MATTPKLALRYPGPTDPPDGPGAVSNLATDLDNLLGAIGWAPFLGQGPTTGNNGGSSGSALRIGKHLFARGRILFGSSAGWGSSGSGTVGGFPLTSNIDQTLSTGKGRFTAQGGSTYPVAFTPHPNGTEMWIAPEISNGSGSPSYLGNAFQLGSIPQSSVLVFEMSIVML